MSSPMGPDGGATKGCVHKVISAPYPLSGFGRMASSTDMTNYLNQHLNPDYVALFHRTDKYEGSLLKYGDSQSAIGFKHSLAAR